MVSIETKKVIYASLLLRIDKNRDFSRNRPQRWQQTFSRNFLSINLYWFTLNVLEGEKKIWNDLFFRLSCYPIVPHTPTVGTIMVILYSSVIFWCSAIKDIVWGHGRMAVKSYIPSTINVRGKLLIPVIWADKNGLVFGKLACTSSTRSIRL